MSRRTARTPAAALDRFITTLSLGSTVAESCRAAGIGRRTVYALRRTDSDFAAQWDSALEEGAERCDDEALRRAVDGWDEPVFFQGQIGHVRKYDSTLLISLLKSRRPEKYRDSFKVESTTTISDARSNAVRVVAERDPELVERMSRMLAEATP